MSPQNVHAANRIPMECKLYVWSIVLEPLLFFVLSGTLSLGMHITFARIVQFVFILLLISKALLSKQELFLPNPSNRNYIFFSAYFCLLLISSLLGYAFFGSYKLTKIEGSDYSMRIILEFFILAFYIFYFVILPKYVLTSKSKILYLLKCIERTFYLCLFLGFLDLFFAYFSLGFMHGSGFIPRHLVDTGWVGVGVRFHGFAGEPRDAFPYLIFGALLIQVKTALLGQKTSKMLLPIVSIALVSTQSGSGMIGIGLGIAIFALFSICSASISINKIKIIAATALLAIATVYIASQSERLQAYYDVYSDIFDVISSGATLPYLFVIQSNNIYPLWQLLQNINNFEFFSVLFGNGLGSAAFVNNNLGDFGETVVNPHAQITRTLFEGGIIGLWFFILAFYIPFKTFINHLPKVNKQYYYLIFFLLIGAALGHRSTSIYVFTGIIISICHIWFQQAPLSQHNLRSSNAILPSDARQ